jgi:hypothetical protein
MPVRLARSCTTTSRRFPRVTRRSRVPGSGKAGASWDASTLVSIMSDGQLGRIEGWLNLSSERRLSGRLWVLLHRRTSHEDRAPDLFQVFYFRIVSAHQDRASGSTTCHRSAVGSPPSSVGIPPLELLGPRRSMPGRRPSPGPGCRSSGP